MDNLISSPVSKIRIALVGTNPHAKFGRTFLCRIGTTRRSFWLTEPSFGSYNVHTTGPPVYTMGIVIRR